MLERDFQKKVIDQIQEELPYSIVLKNDATYLQGFPDLIILYGQRWAVLECKKSKDEPYRPNQKYYLNKTDLMSFSATIYPENMEEVLDELYKTFRVKR